MKNSLSGIGSGKPCNALLAIQCVFVIAGAAIAAEPSAEQYRMAAALPGAKVSWSHERGVPLSVRGPDLGAVNLGGRGLAPGVSFETRAVAVMDRLAGLYLVRDAQTEFGAERMDESDNGWRHVRLAQRHCGLTVVGAGMIVHFAPDGAPAMVNGRYIPGIGNDTHPVLSADDAASRAANAIRAGHGSAGDLACPQTPVLVIYARRGAPSLAYEVRLSGKRTMDRWVCWVDAGNGAILECYRDVRTSGLTDKAAVLITGRLLPGEGGAEAVVSGNQENSIYQLASNSGYKWQVVNADTNNLYPDSSAIAWRTNANWGTSDTEEFSAAYNFWQILAYYNTVHGRMGYDGRDAMARINVHHADTNLDNNACWSPSAQQFFFGIPDNTTLSGLEVLDVSAHEFGHAIDSFTANLTYSHESGALSESFADILAVLVEFYYQPDGRAAYPGYTAGSADWLLGEDCTLGAYRCMRDMRNPASASASGGRQPTKYRGANWYTGSDDFGGVHANGGVQNFFFYLLVEGGSGVNDGIAYDISGLGTEAARILAYRTLTSYATPNMDHYDAREAWIGAAMESVSQHPDWPLTIAAAWSAVGVDPDTKPAMPVLADFDGDALADPALFEPHSGKWTFMLSTLGYRHLEQVLAGSAFDSYDKTPHAYDYDGDRRADPTVYKDYWTIWTLWLSGSMYAMFEGEWGGGGCFAAAGDVDGDRRGDFNYYSYGQGAWHFCLSSGNYDTHAYLNFGLSWRSTPIVADFDGDGLDDPALYDSNTGTWSILTSSGGYHNAIPVSNFGGGGDPAVAGDVDGDMKADLAVYHTSSNAWDFMLSGQHYAVIRNISL